MAETTSDRNLDPRDLTADVIRALVLYSLAEHQSGHATTIRVTAEGTSFSVADDGRGHAIERVVGSESYLKFIYTHLDYPFEADQNAPVQVHGIGMSLINTLCSELTVTVKKPNATLRLSFRYGQPNGKELIDIASNETGNTIAGTISPHQKRTGVNAQQLEQWLRNILTACPALNLHFNGRQLQAQHRLDT